MQNIERKLAAIVSADVVGWSRLMGRDEAGTLAALKAHREELIDPKICDHGGRVVGTAGDSLLVEFSSCVNAVQCAVDVQKELKQRNVDKPEDRRMVFRVGINLGEVIVDGDDIFGDGVNIAARLQALANPGEVYVSEDVYRQVSGRLDVSFDDLGEQAVKNIARPIHVYRVVEGASAAADRRDGSEKAQPSKPSIAVLPFDNMSGDAEQEYFADGITEDIITELSRYADLFVIARNSTFVYKGKAVDLKQVGRDLGVRYVVEGSVRKAGNRVRITVQLIDAQEGHHLWAERFDRQLEDVFALQDEITQMIVAALPGRVEAAQMALAKRKPPQAMAAYDYLLRAKDHHHRRTKDDNAKALEMAERAIALDPEYAQAHAWKACIIGQSWANGYGVTMQELTAGAEELMRTLERLSANEFECHRLLAAIYFFFFRQQERALVHQERAQALVPNDPRIVSQRGELLTYLGEPDEAAEWIERAMQLDPSEADRRAGHLGQALFVARRYDEAIRAFKRVSPLGARQHAYLAACYAQLGQGERAKAHADAALKLDPSLTVKAGLVLAPYTREEDVAHHREAFLKAGLPE